MNLVEPIHFMRTVTCNIIPITWRSCPSNYFSNKLVQCAWHWFVSIELFLCKSHY